MGIRKATIGDLAGIRFLTKTLSCTGIENLSRKQFLLMLAQPDHILLVYLKAKQVGGFLSLLFVPGIHIKANMALIGYFAVDPAIRSRPVGKELEACAETLCRQHRSDRMVVHLSPRSSKARAFYLEQGYNECPNCFIKHIDHLN